MLYLVAFSAALSAGLLVFGAFTALPAQNRATRTRLIELGLYGRDDVDHRRYRLNRFHELVRAAGARFQARKKDWGPLRARLVHAGYREATALPLFLGARIAAAIGLFGLGMAFGAAIGFPGILSTVLGFWAGFAGWFVPGFVLSVRIARRQREIVKALPDALDLLVICVEAGLGLNQALLRVAAEMRHVNQLITEEIAQTNLEIRAGTPRDAALMNMADRTGVSDMRSLVTLLIQTERFGTSIAKSLRVHADSLRTKRRQRAEEAAAKTAIKMVFPLALCIFPALFVVVLGPALIQVFNTLGGLG
ncbi:MAG: type II secretion system F family protein [Gemmatimonadetes bacterium]|nr:type II secretion system F family protein [Gemmatimonadota bacterium]MBT8402629.1 type II secretion system F family protein [Gemmatimonadota bacterium]